MQETIGQRLKREREARYLTLEKASADTRIRSVFLQALEADDYTVMPSAAQGRGFLRNYAEYLDLDIDELIAEIQRNASEREEVSGPLPQVNLVETDVPPLTDTEDEKPAPPIWTRILRRQPKVESTPEPIEIESAQPVEETEVKPEAENPLEEPEQAKVEEEAKPGLMQRLKSMFRVNIRRQESEPVISPEIEEEKVEETPSQPSLPADVILAEIGSQLHARREMISLTLEEVERHTRLRAVFVKALEEGKFDNLPSTVQTRGMLANYATFLDLDVDAILLRYADALQARRHEKYAEIPRENVQTQVNASMPVLRTFLAGDLIFGLAIITMLILLAVWGVGSVVRSQEERAEPTAPSIVDVLGDVSLPTASPEATFLAVDDPSVATPGAGGVDLGITEVVTSEVTANVTVSIFALERVFVRISVDGEVAFEGRMSPRETKIFEAEEQVVVLTGDASALRITYNGRELGLMGGVGEVVNNVYTISGIVTPTATIPPTPTNTPPVTPTFTPSPTTTPTAPSQ